MIVHTWRSLSDVDKDELQREWEENIEDYYNIFYMKVCTEMSWSEEK